MTPIARTTLAAAFVSAFCLMAASAEAADISGTWEFKVDISGQQGTPTFTFKQDGEKLTGKYKGQFGEVDLKGTIKGDKVEWSFELQPGANAVYKGELDDEAMKGTCDYAGQADGTWTATKKEE
jgi:hypothetical protein